MNKVKKLQTYYDTRRPDWHHLMLNKQRVFMIRETDARVGSICTKFHLDLKGWVYNTNVNRSKVMQSRKRIMPVSDWNKKAYEYIDMDFNSVKEATQFAQKIVNSIVRSMICKSIKIL